VTAEYRYLLVDASTGSNIGELPLTVSSYTYQLNGVGQLTATIPRDHPMAQDTFWALYLSTNSDREITILRDDSPVWNGPSTILGASLQDRTQMQVAGREASWYMQKRTLEEDKNYLGWDLFDIARDLGAYMVSKVSTAGDGMTAGSNINAALPRWAVAPASGLSGFILPSANVPSYYGSSRHLIADIADGLVADPSSGLDYRMEYTDSSSWVRCTRTLTFGAPLGVTRTQKLTEHILYDFAKTEDRERAANRVHTLSGTAPYVLQNTGSTANGDLLIESVFDESGVTDAATVHAFTRDARRRAQPPVAVYSATFVPDAALPWGWCMVGDIVNLAVEGTTILHSEGTVRVTAIEVVPPQGGNPELVTLTLGVPLDALGA
jgi:hypothetical protein